MTWKLMKLAKALLAGEMSPADFELQYLVLWRAEAESGELAKYQGALGDCVSTLFILADCYTSDEDRNESELDDEGLLREVRETLEKHNLL